MEITKNKSSQPIKFTVKASKKNIEYHCIKRTIKNKSKFRRDLLMAPEDYYSTELKRFTRGKTQAIALCPFHNDRHPSFTISLRTGAFLCFACGVRGGDIISYYMKRHGLSFVEACKALGVWNE